MKITSKRFFGRLIIRVLTARANASDMDVKNKLMSLSKILGYIDGSDIHLCDLEKIDVLCRVGNLAALMRRHSDIYRGLSTSYEIHRIDGMREPRSVTKLDMFMLQPTTDVSYECRYYSFREFIVLVIAMLDDMSNMDKSLLGGVLSNHISDIVEIANTIIKTKVR